MASLLSPAPSRMKRLMPAAKKHRQRRGESVPEDAAFVVRGDLLDPAVLAESARENHSIYGFFGVSVFAEVGGITWDEIAATKLRRAEWIVLFTARDLLARAAWSSGTPASRRTTTSSTTNSTNSWAVSLDVNTGSCETRRIR